MICIEATIYRTRNLDNFYLELFQLVMAKLAIRGHFEESGNHYEKYNLNLSQLVICYSFSNSPRTTGNNPPECGKCIDSDIFFQYVFSDNLYLFQH